MSTQNVKGSLILAFAGISHHGPLDPDGRVFRRLAGEVPNFLIRDDGSVEAMTYEEAFLIRFMRWLPPPLRRDFMALFGNKHGIPCLETKMKDLMTKLDAHEAACPPPWAQEAA